MAGHIALDAQTASRGVLQTGVGPNTFQGAEYMARSIGDFFSHGMHKPEARHEEMALPASVLPGPKG